MSAFLEASNQPSHPSSSPGYPGSQPQPMMQTMVATTPVAYPPQQQPVSDGTCCDCANPDIGSRTPLRVIGALVIVLSIVEFGVGGSAASYVRNDGHGSWWVALFTLLTGILCVGASNRGWVWGVLFTSMLAFVLTIIGTSIDGVGRLFFRDITACSGANSQIYARNPSDATQHAISANNCRPGGSSFMPGMGGGPSTFPPNTCFCYGDMSSFMIGCYPPLTLSKNETDCSVLWTKMAPRLSASAGILGVMIPISLIQVILASVILCRCCRGSEVDANGVSIAQHAPPVMVVQMQAQPPQPAPGQPYPQQPYPQQQPYPHQQPYPQHPQQGMMVQLPNGAMALVQPVTMPQQGYAPHGGYFPGQQQPGPFPGALAAGATGYAGYPAAQQPVPGGYPTVAATPQTAPTLAPVQGSAQSFVPSAVQVVAAQQQN